MRWRRTSRPSRPTAAPSTSTWRSTPTSATSWPTIPTASSPPWNATRPSGSPLPTFAPGSAYCPTSGCCRNTRGAAPAAPSSTASSPTANGPAPASSWRWCRPSPVSRPGAAEDLGAVLTRLLTGKDVTTDLFNRRGQADLDRIDRVTRNITRDVDHIHWLKERHLKAAFVQQGARIAAYAYGGIDQVGPVAGSTPDAALSGLGWALDLAVASGATGSLVLRVPAPFTSAVETLLDSSARIEATLLLYGRGVSLALDRSVFGSASLP
jgi:hypothetical protein